MAWAVEKGLPRTVPLMDCTMRSMVPGGRLPAMVAVMWPGAV